ncbi:MAG: PAS domain-containing hybrid sensor histidine kinase/response regulator [Proteobacteria bacterium]|nr:PAS domain-containing hybrid sensor histidine kinase/response regulator [Pseudomonadota bacterium]
MNRLLEKQLLKATGKTSVEGDLAKLLDVISKTYDDYERMRSIESRAMQLMSDELTAANAEILRESEEKISQSQRRFEIAVSGTQDGIWDWNVRENVLWFSRRAVSMLGYRDHDFVRPSIETWLELVHRDDLENARNFLNACKKGEAHPVITLRMLDRGGRIRHILCRAQGILDSAGQAARVVGVHTDLTDIIAMQEELRKSKDRAEAANRAKSDFLANMTHELRTPLNSIITLAKLSSETSDEAERKKFLDIVTVSSEMLLAIVNDVLDFSKIEANEMKLEHIGFDLVSAVGKALVPVRHTAAGKGLDFKITFDCQGQIPFVMGDPLRLAQVITNLATNAVKYTDTGSVGVTLRVTVDDVDSTADISIEVKDTGIGIPPDRQKTVFEKFSQADTSTTRRYGGSGLGLAISSRIVSLMGGKIELTSEEGKGTTFTVRLCMPLASTLHVESQHETLLDPGVGVIPAEDARVLVVEDHPMNQIVAEKVLQRFGIRHVAVAENGKVALNILKSDAYDLVLMDCFMPELDGYEATRRIREAEKGTDTHIPIIAITANASVADKERCLAAGMDHYTVKPLIERDLLRILGNYIRFSPQVLTTQNVLAHSVPQTLDLSVLKGYSNGDAGTEALLVDAFLMQSRINISKLKEALAEGEAKKWVSAAHTLKGGARSIGAGNLGQLSALAQEEVGVEKSVCIPLLDRIVVEFSKVEEGLKKHLKKAG